MAGLTGLAAAARVCGGFWLVSRGSKKDSLGCNRKRRGITLQQFAKFKFNPDGKFKILHLTDTHYVSGILAPNGR